jgi:hypothetical protein
VRAVQLEDHDGDQDRDDAVAERLESARRHPARLALVSDRATCAYWTASRMGRLGRAVPEGIAMRTLVCAEMGPAWQSSLTYGR